MARTPRILPLRNVALYGFILNAAWEFVQCVFLYDMWGSGFWRAAAWMWGAIIGDVLIVLGVTLLARLTVGSQHLLPPDRRGWAALLGVGFAASVFLEWLARALALWEYSSLMPTLTFFGYTVGLSPVVQITILPALSVYLAVRRRYVRAESAQAL